MSSKTLMRAFGKVLSVVFVSSFSLTTRKDPDEESSFRSYFIWFSRLNKTAGLNPMCRFERGMALQNVRTKPSNKIGKFREGGYLLLIIPLTTTYLGVWQLKRKKWKENLIATLNEGMSMEPVALPDNLAELKDMEYKAVYVDGEFDYAHEMYLGPRSDVPDYEKHASQRHSGVHVVTPFKLSDRNLTIMINRGWLEARDWENEERRKNAQVHGHRRVVGVVRKDQEEPWFLDVTKPTDKKGLKFFLTRNLERLAKECHSAPVYIDAIELSMQPGAPKGIRPQNDLRNDHLQYAITWFFVAGISLSVWMRQFGRPLKPAVIKRSLLKQEAVRNNRRT